MVDIYSSYILEQNATSDVIRGSMIMDFRIMLEYCSTILLETKQSLFAIRSSMIIDGSCSSNILEDLVMAPHHSR